MEFLFTWHDVEIIFEKNRLSWPKSWFDVKVYSDSVLIYYAPGDFNEEDNRQYLKSIFLKNYNSIENKILVDFTQTYLEIEFEEDENESKKIRSYAPLFKDIYLSKLKIDNNEKDLPGSRILAFHSYKGGVGRTLSLISLLRECTTQYPEKKILVIDADLEAPGLTWMLEDKGYRSISYVDILSLMNFETITDKLIDKIAEMIRSSTIEVTTDKQTREQYFIPAFRKLEQTMGIYSNPQRILMTQDNKYFITETLSKIGAALGADFILIDLRAGISEYSAPFLFDPRIEKFYVTSTSLQSIRGVNQILEQIYGKTKADLLNSKILISMIPKMMKEEQLQEIEDQILKNIEERFDSKTATFLRNNYIVRLGFEDSLIHLEDFVSVCSLLQGKEITKVMKELAEGLFAPSEKSEILFQESEARDILRKIYEIADSEVTAEGNSSPNMLVTSSIKEIVRNFNFELPRIVVGGAKGSGKTYIYKQLLSTKTWEGFQRIVGNSGTLSDDKTLIVPLISSLNLKFIKPLIGECISLVNSEIDSIKIKDNTVYQNFTNLKRCLEMKKSQSQWTEKWKDTILSLFEEKFSTLSELDEFLEKQDKKIIFIVDGLEDLCMDAQSANTEGWKYAIRAICQYLINDLDNLDYGNIGIIVFARRDMLSEAIEVNYEQFRNIYSKYELNWNQTEALRLALWLTAKAYPEITDKVNILQATKEVLIEKLTRLWGIKLGANDSKEAYSDRWILAALSDFTGQLQARDIVRFLKYSTQSYQNMKMTYQDRLIMPLDIRNAINPCSKEKLQEIKKEMKNTYEILEKFIQMDTDKTLPMTLNKIELTAEQISKLEAQGFLKISEKKYYLPEIIRLALGFKYEKGARPKVLSLLAK